MTISELLKELTDCNITLLGRGNPALDVYALYFYDPAETTFETNILYVCDTAQMPQPDNTMPMQILCYGDSIDFSIYDGSSLNILYWQDTAPIIVLFNRIQNLINSMQKGNAALHLFANAFFSNQGLQHMVDVAYEIFGNPVFVVDSSYKYLAFSSGITPNNTILETENSSGYIAEKGIQLIREYHLDNKIRNSTTPFYFNNPLHETGMLITPICIHEIDVGKVMLYELNQSFSDLDPHLLSRFTLFVSMELQKDSFYSHNKDVMFSYFLADLLDNPEVNYPNTRERLQLLGFSLKDDLYIMTISAASYHGATAKLEVIVRELHNILVGSLYAIYENSLVMLFSRSRVGGLSEYELDMLSNYLSANYLAAGMSNFFTDLKESRRFYLQAKKAAAIGLRLKEKGPIHYYQDGYFYHIMEICEKEEELRYFIHPAMMKLLYYDNDKNSELLKTLHTFLETPSNPANIASVLHIHKNTLLYRMNKIKSLTSCTLEDGDEIMSLGLSYKIMRYLHMLPER